MSCSIVTGWFVTNKYFFNYFLTDLLGLLIDSERIYMFVTSRSIRFFFYHDADMYEKPLID